MFFLVFKQLAICIPKLIQAIHLHIRVQFISHASQSQPRHTSGTIFFYMVTSFDPAFWPS